jgi:hypothetical protein
MSRGELHTVEGRWIRRVAAAAIVSAGVLVTGATGRAQQPATPAPPAAGAQQAQQAAPARVFGSDAGMVLNFIKPDKTADFEAIVAKLKEALAKSDKPERKEQAASWKVFRAVEPGANGAVLYVFNVDPAVKGADYTVSTILAEAFPPAEVNTLYRQYAEAYASGQNFVNLTLVAALGQ